MEPDLALLEQWRAGDRQAGQDLFARHFASIYRFFENKVGAEADELSQQTFAACVAARDQFRGQSSFRTYLFVIARHELYGYLRRKARADDMDFGVSSIAEVVTSPSSKLARAEDAGQLRQALTRLPAEQQLLLELHYWHELDAPALGEVFATNPGTIRVRLLRARKALREQMAGMGAVVAAAGSAPTDPLAASLLEPDGEEPEPASTGG
jgi:RNA polymerase sigma-70 factor (ECF subfamily)